MTRRVPPPDIPKVVEPACPWLPVAEKRYREEAADYPAIVAVLNARWRVIECRDGIQWILQRLAGKRHGQPRWEGRCYFRTREGLLRRVHELAGPIDGNSLDILQDLPDWIGQGNAAQIEVGGGDVGKGYASTLCHNSLSAPKGDG